MKPLRLTLLSRGLALILVLVGFCVPFLFEGGHIAALIQPLALFSITVLTYSFSAWRVGFRTTNRLLIYHTLKLDAKMSTEAPDSTGVLFQSVFAATHLTGIGYMSLIIQHIAGGNVVIGHLFTALTVNYLFGMGLMALGDLRSSNRVIALLGTAAIACLPSILLAFKFI